MANLLQSVKSAMEIHDNLKDSETAVTESLVKLYDEMRNYVSEMFDYCMNYPTHNDEHQLTAELNSLTEKYGYYLNIFNALVKILNGESLLDKTVNKIKGDPDFRDKISEINPDLLTFMESKVGGNTFLSNDDIDVDDLTNIPQSVSNKPSVRSGSKKSSGNAPFVLPEPEKLGKTSKKMSSKNVNQTAQADAALADLLGPGATADDFS